MSARRLALDYIDAVIHDRRQDESAILSRAGLLIREDRALFNEFTHGVLREWFFLDAVIQKYVKKKPRPKIRNLIYLAAYTLLFLDRIPDYANFSEIRKIAEESGFSEPEVKFVHGVLKKIERERAELHALHFKTRGKLFPKELLSVMTIDGDQDRALTALKVMSEPAPIVGYTIPGMQNKREYPSLASEFAPDAVLLDALAVQEDKSVRVQGISSQLACFMATEIILRHQKPDRPVRILEMASGKGGKLLGTLVQLERAHLKEGRKVPPIEWIAADASAAQLELLKHDVLPYVSKLWPQVKVELKLMDFKEPVKLQPFDFVWLDAPCTGFGTLAKIPQIAITRGPEAIKRSREMATLQRGLVDRAAKYLGADGDFMYSVCTLTQSETLDVAEYAKHALGRNHKLLQMIWPGEEHVPQSAEGFFISVF